MTQREPGGHLAFRSTVSEPGMKPTKWTGAMVFDGADASEGVVRTSSPYFGGATEIKVIADGDSFYSRPNGLPQRERKWLGFGYAVGQGTDEFDFVGADAARELGALGEATDVVAAGTGKVRGVETTRFRGRAPGLGPVDVWIDDNDRIRRLRVVGAQIKEGKTPEVATMTVDLFDFGAVPEIKQPARWDVASVLEFEKGELERQGD